jgi:hypothetical protein
MSFTVKKLNGKFLAMLCLVFCLSLIVVAAECHEPGYEIDAVYGTTPSIDGQISGAEWKDATEESYTKTKVYVKQNGVSLYIAFNVSDNTVSSSKDGVGFFIDVDHNGGTSRKSDDIFFGIYRNNTRIEFHDEDPPVSPSDWSASAYSTSSYWQAEFRISYTKIGLTAGVTKTLGIMFTTQDNPDWYFWPPMSELEAYIPDNWGDLVSSEHWIPEFPATAMMIMILLMFTLAIVVPKLKKT